MKSTKRRLRYEAWLSIPCDTCNAAVGQVCVAKSGKPAAISGTHAARWKKANALVY